MAETNFTFLALPFSSSILPFEFSSRLFCSHCASNSIPLPQGATPSTRFTCRECSAALLRARDPKTATTLAEIGAEIDARVWRGSFAGQPGDGAQPRSIQEEAFK